MKCPLEIDSQDLVEILDRRLFDCGDESRPSIVYQYVEPAESAHAPLDGSLQRRRVGYITGEHQRSATQGLDLRCNGLEPISSASDKANLGTNPPHRERGHLPDAARRSRDQNNSPAQLDWHETSIRSSFDGLR
jgi:hypothetical protein